MIQYMKCLIQLQVTFSTCISNHKENHACKLKPTWERRNLLKDERKSEQAHIPHAPTLLEKAVYNEWKFQALGTGNQTKKGI